MATVLVTEDEQDIRELICFNLEEEGHRTLACASGEEALMTAASDQPDLIILDLMLPGISGFDVCRALKKRESTRHIPVIMLTARTGDEDVVKGLEEGADDYVTKPFSPRILLARVKAALRRESAPSQEEPEVIRLHRLELDTNQHRVSVKGQQVSLSATEFSILKYLASNPGWVFSRNQIINAVKGENYPVTERSVDVQILGIRKKLGGQGRFIETVRGVGYRMKEGED